MSRYILSKMPDAPGWWIATDNEQGVTCKFLEHQFNDTQKFSFVGDKSGGKAVKRLGATGIASTLNKLAKWLLENHSDIIL